MSSETPEDLHIDIWIIHWLRLTPRGLCFRGWFAYFCAVNVGDPACGTSRFVGLVDVITCHSESSLGRHLRGGGSDDGSPTLGPPPRVGLFASAFLPMGETFPWERRLLKSALPGIKPSQNGLLERDSENKPIEACFPGCFIPLFDCNFPGFTSSTDLMPWAWRSGGCRYL